MKKFQKLFISILPVILLAVLCGCSKTAEEQATVAQPESVEAVSEEASETTESTEESSQEAKRPVDFLITETMESAAIAQNIVNEPTERKFYVCLPPSYFESEKEYPVVYYLHGQADSVKGFPGSNFSKLFREFENGADEFILVCVDGYSNMGGAFYANSPVSGNWEDYMVEEVVSYVDENYRTIAERDSRGICGFSMGGFGAYYLAFRHPDVYSCVLSMSPGAIADGDMASAMETWQGDNMFLTGYGRAFSPNVDAPDDGYANIPTMDGSEADELIVADWYNGFGNINEKLDAYEALDTPLTAIKIVYGENDGYSWIPRGCDFLAEKMDEREIEYVLETHDGGHSLPPGVVENQILPFFNENLAY